MDALLSLPPLALILLGAIILLQLALQITALVVLLQTPPERLRFGRRWLWILIIVLGEILGAILFLALGRREAEAEDAPLSRGEDAAKRAVDLLYGEKKE